MTPHLADPPRAQASPAPHACLARPAAQTLHLHSVILHLLGKFTISNVNGVGACSMLRRTGCLFASSIVVELIQTSIHTKYKKAVMQVSSCFSTLQDSNTVLSSGILLVGRISALLR